MRGRRWPAGLSARGTLLTAWPRRINAAICTFGTSSPSKIAGVTQAIGGPIVEEIHRQAPLTCVVLDIHRLEDGSYAQSLAVGRPRNPRRSRAQGRRLVALPLRLRQRRHVVPFGTACPAGARIAACPIWLSC
jgi:hypothetical protein